MPVSNILRRAAQIIDSGWSNSGPLNANGSLVTLFGGTVGDTARAGVNPDITQHTLYSAIVKAMNETSDASGMGAAWERLDKAIREKHGYTPGGMNHLHPVHGFNVAEGRTAEDIKALLLEVAASFDPAVPSSAPSLTVVPAASTADHPVGPSPFVGGDK